MKKSTILLLLFIGIYVSVNAQVSQEFASVGAEWYYNNASSHGPYGHFKYFKSEKDTIVAGDSCRILKQYFDSTTTATESYIIKQNAGKIYYYYRNEWNLLFDFDVQVDDTVIFTFMYDKYNYDTSETIDSVFSARFVIHSIETNNQELKTIVSEIIGEDIPVSEGEPIFASFTYSYTEKIGLSYLKGVPEYSGFIPYFSNLPQIAVDYLEFLRCYSDSEISYTTDTWAATSLPCDNTVLDIEDISAKQKLNIFPNPSTGIVNIISNENSLVSIFDITGKIVAEYNVNANEEFSFSQFAGIYIVKIESYNKVTIQKLIIEQ